MKELKRCSWSGDVSDEYISYHDVEWGVPVYDDRTLFEFLVLEGAQAGLSWATILKKREGYRTNFAQFDPAKVAKFSDAKLEKVLLDPTVVRNRLKVFGVRKNAQAFLRVQEEFGSFSKYLWAYVGDTQINNEFESSTEVPATSDISDTLAKDLKKRGFTFVGSTIMYAYMQAVGLVNDHTADCFRYEEIRKEIKSKA